MEILRVLPSLADFDPGRLSTCYRSMPAETQRGFIAEAHAFIRLTEEASLKRDLESGSLYFRLMHVIVCVERDTGAFPLLHGLLRSLAGQP